MVNIIVIGAGLAGLAASLGLANLGYEVDLVEKLHSFDRRGTALSLAPNGIKALNEICGEEFVQELCSNGVAMPQFQQYLLGWWMVRDFLLEKVLQNDNIRLYKGWNLDKIVDESKLNNASNNNIKAIFCPTTSENNIDNDEKNNGYHKDATDTSSSSSLLTLEGAMLIGADGIRSKVREILGLPKSQYADKTQWRGTIQIPKNCIVLGPLLEKGFLPLQGTILDKPHIRLQLFNFHDKHPGLMSFSVTTSLDVVNAQNNDNDNKNNNNNNNNNSNADEKYNMQTLLEEHFQDRPDELPILYKVCELVDDFDLNNPVPVRVINPKKLSNNNYLLSLLFFVFRRGWGGCGRITLIGDAAHATRPYSGLGASLAFEDVAMLCRHLKNNNKNNNDENKVTTRNDDSNTIENRKYCERLIRKFEQSRISRVSKIWQSEWKMAEYLYKHQKPKSMKPKFQQWVYKGI